MKRKKIEPNEEFIMGNQVFSYSIDDGKMKLRMVGPADVKPTKPKKEITPPSEQEVKEYAIKNGYKPDFMWEKMKGYIEAGMKDSHDNPVVNWKLKLNQVWFDPKHKIEQPTQQQNKVVSNFFQND